jgi:excisionase family DNA binding protein
MQNDGMVDPPSDPTMPAAEAPRGGVTAPWLRELRQRGWELASELDYAPQTVDMEFLNFLRNNSRFGFFIFGPVTIDVRVVEDIFYRTAPRGSGGPDHPPIADDYLRFGHRLVAEMRKSGRRELDELAYLLAFMRTDERLPARVFGELGVSAEDVERYAASLTAGTAGGAPAERLLTTEEAAEYYGVHVQTVRAWIRAGKLPASKLAGQKSIRIWESDLKKVLEPAGPDAALD